MNFTYVIFCDCGFEKVLHETVDQTILQCQGCRNIESKDKKMGYHLDCQACGTLTPIGSNATFDEWNLPTCPECQMQGAVGFQRGKNIQFLLGSDQNQMDSCTNCHRTDWNELSNTELTCPMCFSGLQQKMSNYWE